MALSVCEFEINPSVLNCNWLTVDSSVIMYLLMPFCFVCAIFACWLNFQNWCCAIFKTVLPVFLCFFSFIFFHQAFEILDKFPEEPPQWNWNLIIVEHQKKNGVLFLFTETVSSSLSFFIIFIMDDIFLWWNYLFVSDIAFFPSFHWKVCRDLLLQILDGNSVFSRVYHG